MLRNFPQDIGTFIGKFEAPKIISGFVALLVWLAPALISVKIPKLIFRWFFGLSIFVLTEVWPFASQIMANCPS